MFGSPFLNTLNVFTGAKVVLVFFLGQPACLSCGLTRLAAFWFTAVFLFVNVASIRREKITTILTFNILIIKTLKQRNKYFEEQKQSTIEPNVGSPQTAPSSGQSNKDIQLVVMLLTVSFGFLILTFPIYTRYIMFIYIKYKQDPYMYAIYWFAYHLSNKLYFVNNAVNFYLYCLSGSKFCKETRQLLGCFMRCSRKNTDI